MSSVVPPGLYSSLRPVITRFTVLRDVRSRFFLLQRWPQPVRDLDNICDRQPPNRVKRQRQRNALIYSQSGL